MFRNGHSASPSPDRLAAEWTLAPEVDLGVGGRVEEIWRYRRILMFFTVKAIQALYAKTRLGPIWLVIRPLSPIVAAALVFGSIVKVPSDGVPYFLFLLTGTTIWNFFDSPLIYATRGLEANRVLITKVYIPRLILPVGQMAAGLVEPLVCVAALVVTLLWHRAADGIWHARLSPRLTIAALAIVMALLLAFSISLWTSVWQARARDMRFALMYTLTFWYLLTPVVYPSSTLPPAARMVAHLNPMMGPVEAFKWAVLGVGTLSISALIVSGTVTMIVLGLGLWYFTAAEAQTIDKV